MNDDDPADVVHERFAELVLGSHPLGRPIGGTPETIAAVGRDAVAAHYRRHYLAPGLVVTAAGGIDHDEIVAMIAEQLATSGWRGTDAVTPLPRRGVGPGGGAGAPVPLSELGPVVGWCCAGRPSRPTSSWAPSGSPRTTSAATSWASSTRSSAAA